jgi:hypothetical protein
MHFQDAGLEPIYIKHRKSVNPQATQQQAHHNTQQTTPTHTSMPMPCTLTLRSSTTQNVGLSLVCVCHIGFNIPRSHAGLKGSRGSDMIVSFKNFLGDAVTAAVEYNVAASKFEKYSIFGRSIQ